MTDSPATSGVESEKFEEHLAAGGELLRGNRVKEARKEFEAALELRPDDRKALGLVGLACFRLSAYDDALRVYRELVKAHPDDASYRLNLGLVYLKLGNPDDAIIELERTRDLDPSMSKAVGYLGLAHARNGNFLEAYEAFKRVGQNDLAAEMEQHLTAEEIAAVTKRVAAGAALIARAAAQAAPPLSDVEVGEDSAVEVEHEAVVSVEEAEPGAADDAEHEGEPDIVAEFDDEPGVVSGELPLSGPSAVTDAVQAAEPTGSAESESQPSARGQQPPISLSAFATARMIRPEDSDHPFEISAGGVLVVRVRGRVMSRTEGVIVSGGELAFEPATRKVRGNLVDEPFGGDRPLFIVTGDGHLVASPLRQHFAAVRLDEDVLYLREDLVFAFEERLRWENGFVPGSDAKIAVVQFRGNGCVAVRTRKPTLAVKLGPERVLYVDVDALAGWVGRVVPRVVAPAAGGETSALFVECSGEGVVLLEDETEPQGSNGS